MLKKGKKPAATSKEGTIDELSPRNRVVHVTAEMNLE